MEPFSPNDPVFKLLGKAKTVEPRPNFTQNVLRAIRQEPPPATFWSRVKTWGIRWAGGTPGAAWAGVAVATVLTALLIWPSSGPEPEPAAGPSQPALLAEAPRPAVAAPAAAVVPGLGEVQEETAFVESTVASEFESMDQLSVLLAQQDTSALTDSEIALLLY
jgi:hypothetical protein